MGLRVLTLLIFPKLKHLQSIVFKNLASRPAGAHAEARSLSGGNLQKFIVGREILQQPNFLIISQPTWA